MITPAYSATATERVLPRMALDFTTGVLDPRVTVARLLNTATSVNSSGLIELVNANLPRFDYDPVTLAPKGLLIEEARTNPILQSAAFNVANYGKVASSIDPNVAASPDGATLADEFIVDGTTGVHYLQQANTGMVSSSTYTWSVYAKANTMPYLVLSLYNTTANNYACASFDLTTNTVENTGAAGTGISLVSTSVVNAGNGWYRYIITAVAGTNAFNRCGIGMSLDGTVAGTFGMPSFAGDGASSFYLWGAQLETGAFPTSYIPTTTLAVTRNGDQASMTGANFTSWFSVGPGTLYTQASQPVIYAGSRSAASLCASANNPRISNYRQSAGGINGYAINSAGAGNAGGSGVVATSNSRQSTITSYTATNSQIVSANASAIATIATDMSTSLSAFTGLAIGNDFLRPTLQFCGHIQKVMWWPIKMTNAEAQAFSK